MTAELKIAIIALIAISISNFSYVPIDDYLLGRFLQMQLNWDFQLRILGPVCRKMIRLKKKITRKDVESTRNASENILVINLIVHGSAQNDRETEKDLSDR